MDICCGTGSIGIALANYFDRVFGVEMVESAVVDATANVELNGLGEKCKFIHGKAEDKVADLCESASQVRISIISVSENDLLHFVQKEMEVVAIVDPPRAGLPKKVLSVLRANDQIESLVFVSCDSGNKMAQGNIVDLTRDSSKSLRGRPFRIAHAQPVDLFPHTPHFELVFLLLRGKALDRFLQEESKEVKVESECTGETTRETAQNSGVKIESSEAPKEEASEPCNAEPSS